MDGGLIVVAVVFLITVAMAYGAFGRYRGTRGGISRRPREALGRSGAEGRSGPHGSLARDTEFDSRGKK